MMKNSFTAIVILLVIAASLVGCKGDSAAGQVNLNAVPKDAPQTDAAGGTKPAVEAKAKAG